MRSSTTTKNRRVPPPGTSARYGRAITNGRIKAAEIYRSDDAGATWQKTSPNNNFMIEHSGTYGWVFGQIRVDPKDENTIYTLGLSLNVSHDSGKTFTSLRQPHGDNHGLWIDPANPKVLYNSNDGGFYMSEDAGQNWKFAQAAHATQFYNVALDMAAPFHAYGSIQDIGSRRGTIDVSKARDVIEPVAFENAPGGEGSNHAIDPTNPNIVYSHGFYGNFSRTDVGQGGRGGGAATPIQPKDPDAELRAQWMAPFFISPHDASVVYAGYQFLFRSSNRGDSWEKISPDLTSNNPAEMLPKNSSAIPYQSIVAITESPKKKGLLYVGSDDGKLQTTIDNGKEWTELTSHLPVRKWISRVVASEHAEGTVYVTQRGREDDDFAPYVYKSTSFYGRSSTEHRGQRAPGTIKDVEGVKSKRTLSEPILRSLRATTGGTRWEVLGGNLPSVQVSDLQFDLRDNILVASTAIAEITLGVRRVER